MKTKQAKVKKYEAWLSTETMHKGSLKWLSELRFAKDEQLFFDDLIKSYTLQLIDSKHFLRSKKIIDRLSIQQKETEILINTIINHEKGLKIMVDGINQLKEENAYKKEHGKLILKVSRFLEDYRTLKSQLFELIKSIIKEGKQKRLLQ
ncbi:MAG: hypothetical protein P8K68_08800 [Algibacter sp.]|uniref:hypothetical protein n=1 Tax=Algibacter sp. TaxID=1872428 RepID=UPI002626706E|nr:hypothetical protein [Algibacter sp.]MDG1730392.1 hypothetical protein [Algibacter sp.]MDG2178870.1 hypothetical protein [Algibacter sp.]